MSKPNFDLTGRVALVTGTTSGLGRQFALCLAAAGAKLAITGRRKDRLEALKAEIEGMGGTALPIALDANDRPAVEAMVAQVEQELGPIWALVNNAGLTIMKPAVNHTEEDYDTVLDTNLKAPFHLSQLVAKQMIANGKGGRIINIASMAAITELKGGVTYGMSKGGMVNMTKVMALELARHGIRVNAICPGYIRTEMNSDYFDSQAGQREIAGWPNRRVGNPSDLDGLLLLLASDASDFITGAAIVADDGQSLGT